VTAWPFVPYVRVEIGLSGPTVGPLVWHIGDAVRGKIGTAQIGAADVWSDISPAVKSWSFQRGATRSDGLNLRYEPGTCSIVLNNGDRAFDPTNLVGPYASAGVTQLMPMVRVRITAEWAGIAYPLFTGFADSWLPDYDSPTWSTTTLTATDAFKVFSAQDRTAGSAVGAGELSGARINRILDGLGWLTDDRVIAAGDTAMQATTLEGNGLTELYLTQDTELGEFYMSPSGDAVFRNRHAILTEARSNTPQAVFGDGGLGLGELPYASIAVENDDSTMANYVSIAREGGTEQVAQDATSIARYLKKTYQRTDLLHQTDAESLNYALSLLSQSKDPELRFTQVGFDNIRPDVCAVMWPALLGRELGDRITVIRRPPGGGDPNERDVFVRRIEMSSDGPTWKTTFSLQSADRQQFWVIGDPILGRIGMNAIAY
jgi:hypothetical protein